MQYAITIKDWQFHPAEARVKVPARVQLEVKSMNSELPAFQSRPLLLYVESLDIELPALLSGSRAELVLERPGVHTVLALNYPRMKLVIHADSEDPPEPIEPPHTPQQEFL